jgi:ketosteroid isomerase-like protein
MSQETVEVARALANDYARGDYAAVLARFHEEIEFEPPPDLTGGGQTYRGLAETTRAVAEFTLMWDDYHYEVRDLTDFGEDVLVEAWQRGRGRGSGVEVSETIYNLWTIRDGKAVRLRMYRERADALEAVGLSG